MPMRSYLSASSSRLLSLLLILVLGMIPSDGTRSSLAALSMHSTQVNFAESFAKIEPPKLSVDEQIKAALAPHPRDAKVTKLLNRIMDRPDLPHPGVIHYNRNLVRDIAVTEAQKGERDVEEEALKRRQQHGEKVAREEMQKQEQQELEYRIDQAKKRSLVAAQKNSWLDSFHQRSESLAKKARTEEHHYARDGKHAEREEEEKANASLKGLMKEHERMMVKIDAEKQALKLRDEEFNKKKDEEEHKHREEAAEKQRQAERRHEKEELEQAARNSKAQSELEEREKSEKKKQIWEQQIAESRSKSSALADRKQRLQAEQDEKAKQIEDDKLELKREEKEKEEENRDAIAQTKREQQEKKAREEQEKAQLTSERANKQKQEQVNKQHLVEESKVKENGRAAQRKQNQEQEEKEKKRESGNKANMLQEQKHKGEEEVKAVIRSAPFQVKKQQLIAQHGDLLPTKQWQNAYTWTFWVKLSGIVGPWTSLLHHGAFDTMRNPAVFVIPGTNRLHFRSGCEWHPQNGNFGGLANTGCDTVEGLPLNVWTHVSMVHAQGAQNVFFCRDGMPLRHVCGVGVPAPAFPNGPLYAGDPWYPEPPPAYLADLRAYNRPLQNAELQSICNAKRGIT
jgi:hypothetical protein